MATDSSNEAQHAKRPWLVAAILLSLLAPGAPMNLATRLACVLFLGSLFGCQIDLPERFHAGLTHKDPSVRAATVRELGELREPTATPHLEVMAIADRDYRVRRAACEALGKIGDPRSVRRLAEALEYDNEWPVRVAAAEALATMKDDRSVKALLRALAEDREHLVRCEAAEALAQVGDRQALEPLLAAWRTDSNPSVRLDAIRALAELVKSGKIRDEAALRVMLGRLAKDDRLLVRNSAAEALAVVSDPRTLPALTTAIREDPDDWLRAHIVELIADVGDERARDALIGALKDESSRVRAAAVTALSRRGDPRAAAPLAALLDDGMVQRDVEDALQALGPHAVPALCAALQDEKEKELRRRAAEMLGKIADRDAVDPLIRALAADPEPGVRSAAAEALGLIADPRAARPLLAALDSGSDEWVRTKAASALGKLRSMQAVPALIELLDDDIDDLRRAAAQALGEIRDPRAAAPLVAALMDWRNSSWSERQVFEDALKAVGPAAIPALIAAMKDYSSQGSPAESLLEEFGAPAVEPLLAALATNEDARVREGSAHALGRMVLLDVTDDPRVFDALEVASREDGDDAVRRTAQLLLASIEAYAKAGD